MKLKRILSTAIAAVMAVTSFAVTTFTANAAANEPITIWEGELVAGNWAEWATIDTNVFAGYENVTLYFEYSYDASVGDPYPKVSIKDSSWGDIKYVDFSTSAAHATVSTTLTDDELAAVTANSTFILQGASFILHKVSFTAVADGDYVAPTTDVWVTNEDGTYSYQCTANNPEGASEYGGAPISGTGTLTIPAAAFGIVDISTVESVSFTLTSNGMWMYANGTACGQAFELQNGADETVSAEFSLDASAFNTAGDLVIDISWINKGTTLVVSDLVVTTNEPTDTLIPNLTYAQLSADGTAIRFVQMISKELADETSEVVFTITTPDGTGSISSTNYYTSISEYGTSLTPAEGYVFVAVAVTDIPADLSLGDVDCAVSFN